MAPRSLRGPARHWPRQPPIAGDGGTWSLARRLAVLAAAGQERGRALLIPRPAKVVAWPDGPRPAAWWFRGSWDNAAVIMGCQRRHHWAAWRPWTAARASLGPEGLAAAPGRPRWPTPPGGAGCG